MSDTTYEESRPRFLDFLGSMTCFAAAIVFAIVAVFSFPIATFILLFSRTQAGLAPGWVLFALLVALGLPMLAVLFALQPWRPRPRYEAPRASGIARNLLAWAAALVAGPAFLVGWGTLEEARNARARDVAVRHQSRPIVVTTAEGFSAPPVYGSKDGFPTVVLTARVPAEDRYGWTFEGRDHAGMKLFAFSRDSLAAGEHSVPLVARFAEDIPLDQRARPGQKVEWPVVVTLLSVRTIHPPRGSSLPDWKDVRVGDTLTVLSGPH
jgi:hypothetical protein